MILRRLPVLLLVVGMVGGYAYRAVSGAVAGWALDQGHVRYNKSRYGESVSFLEAAAIGSNRLRGLSMTAEAHLDIWDIHVRRRGALGADRSRLSRAAETFLEGRCASPASRSSWEGLGGVYDGLEWIGRERRSTQPYTEVENPWVRVGRSGRIAIGMMRNALELAPNWFRLHDKLAMTLWTYGLEKEAREAVRASARVAPIYHRHLYRRFPELPGWVAEEFAEGSSEVVGQVPLFPRTSHLIDLGKLARRIGDNDRAIRVLREALEGRGDANNWADANFHLGLALIAEGQHDEGKQRLELASENSRFRVAALRSLAAVCERQGDFAKALDHLRSLRWEQPDDLENSLKFAQVAGKLEDWPAALEALMWAKLIHPEDLRAYEMLVETYIEMGELPAARAIVGELAVLPETQARVDRLQRAIKTAARAR